MSTTTPSYETITSGVVMRIGNYDYVAYPDRNQRTVHPSRRSESITYKIERDTFGLRQDDDYGWEFYQYRFTYRYEGRTLTVTWKCGKLHGGPVALEGLSCAIGDARVAREHDDEYEFMHTYGYDDETESAKAKSIYNACVKMDSRLDRFFGSDLDREIWETILEEQ